MTLISISCKLYTTVYLLSFLRHRSMKKGEEVTAMWHESHGTADKATYAKPRLPPLQDSRIGQGNYWDYLF